MIDREKVAAAIVDAYEEGEDGSPVLSACADAAIAAVLEQLQEPSKAMIAAGIAERHEQPVPEAWSLATANIWKAMLGVAK